MFALLHFKINISAMLCLSIHIKTANGFNLKDYYQCRACNAES